MTTIEFGGITFDDEAPTGFTFGRLKGWWDAAPMRLNQNERPQGDGDFGSAKNWRGARVISQQGSYVGETMADTYAAMEQIAAVQSSGVPSPFRVVEPFGAKQCVVSLANGPSVPDQIYTPYFTYTFDVIAADPLKYGDALTTSTTLPTSGGGIAYPITYPIDYGTPGYPGRITVSNPGTADTYSLLEVTGGLAGGFELTEVTTGQVIRFERPIPVGSTVYLNPRTGRASIDGQSDVSGFLTRSEWWSVPAASGGIPGSREIQFNALGAVTGTPTLTSRTSPAFW